MTPDDPRRDLYIRWHPGYAFGEPTICTSAIKAEDRGGQVVHGRYGVDCIFVPVPPSSAEGTP